MTAYDVAEIRRHFPALAVQQDGRALAYFDGPGGTQVPGEVIDAVAGYYREMNANDGGAFLTSERSDAMAVAAKEAVVDFLGARSAEEIKFGPNMTTLTFHVSRSIGATLAAGDEVVVTTLDHEANVSPWQALARDRGLIVRTVDIRADDATLDLDDLDRALERRPKLLAVGWASNALGTVNPVAEIVRRAHAVGAMTYVDAVAWAPHGPIDVAALDTDFLVCSAYKFYGPHAGILYGKLELLDRLPAYKVRPAHDRFQTGTPNFEGIAGVGAAVAYLAALGDRYGQPFRDEYPALNGRRLALRTAMRAVREHEIALFGRLLDGLEAIDGVRLWGITDRARFGERIPTIGITIDGISPRDASAALGRRGIATWDGHFYAQALIERLGLGESGGVVRIGLAHYTTADEIERLLAEVDSVAASARRVSAAPV
ncbi:MAG TPA: cysteine desulfurase-like protein [Candidatus Limnocylindrales bacterium]